MKEKMYYEQLGYEFDPPFYAPTSKPIVTNYDRIIGKTPEELAKWLWFRVGKCPPFDVCPSPCIPCEPKDCWLDWLKQKEAE